LNLRISLAVLATLFFLSACGYEGDGEFAADGVWPFRYYELSLPDVPFEQNTETTFNLSGYKSHGRSLLRITFTAKNPVEFHKLHLPVSITMSTNGDEVFVRDGSLNQHFLRMRSEGATSWPADDEWDCRFPYADSRINSQAVPFDSENDPTPTTQLTCSHFVPTDQSESRLRISIPDIGAGIEEAVVKVKLSSSWK